jgi:hypothetical protein
MKPTTTPHVWSVEALLAKAETYAEEMHRHDHTDWRFGFWSALCLEVVMRGSAASISPALLADGKDLNHTMYAIGREPTITNYVPKSIDIARLVPVLQQVFADFTKELADFCNGHIIRRNAELHSGDVPFDDLGTSAWLPKFYETCKILLPHCNSSLKDLFGKETAAAAEEHIKGAQDDAAKAVKKQVAAHQTIFEELGEEERKAKEERAAAQATRHDGHVVPCPACKTNALLYGTPSGPVKREVKDDEIIEKQAMVPSAFECIACGLRITGYSKLMACGLGDVFTSTTIHDPIEFFSIDPSDFYEPDDYNEPF